MKNPPDSKEFLIRKSAARYSWLNFVMGLLQWIIDHPGEIARSLQMAYALWRKIRARQKAKKRKVQQQKSQEENPPGSNQF